MSRIGKKPVDVPSGVEVKLVDNIITVKGPKGTLERELHPEINVAIEENSIVVTRPSDQKKHRALHGLTRALVNNMVEGVTKGFEKKLELVGVGYRASMQGSKLVLNVGYSHPVEMVPDTGLQVEVGPKQNLIIISGYDKEVVGQFAAKVRAVREPEPYKGKGIKYSDEKIRRKAGKAGGK
ncbi:50S ribosomal protein L6 [Desulfitibacter alkalitolerans]|uniref:50S ribosomal protein L6 n=1 Tax=Desulfitibacter alkalitolerans TaxID=264641 RepID=UPI000489B242|nr:50S ribosomal protein L6 [Desulfitibacter alkalitolerans]